MPFHLKLYALANALAAFEKSNAFLWLHLEQQLGMGAIAFMICVVFVIQSGGYRGKRLFVLRETYFSQECQYFVEKLLLNLPVMKKWEFLVSMSAKAVFLKNNRVLQL